MEGLCPHRMPERRLRGTPPGTIASRINGAASRAPARGAARGAMNTLPLLSAALPLLVAAAVVVSLSACGGSTASDSSPGGAAGTASPSPTTGAAAAAVPANAIWKVVGTGWKDPGSRFHAITFADGDNGLAIGWTPDYRAAHVASTEDGGATWAEATMGVHDQGMAASAIDSPLPGKVWGVGNLGYIATSPDNGMTWTYQAEMTAGQDLNSVSFGDGDKGWAAGWQLNPTMKPAVYTAVMLHTDDGGASWKEQALGLPEERAVKLWAVRFTDAANGWAVGAINDGPSGDPLSGQGLVCHTADGGKTWEMKVAPGKTGLLGAVASIDDAHCWAVDGAGTVVSTSDGGKSWGRSTTDKNAGVCYAIAFADASNGWIAGQKTLLRTTDGGKTWAAEEAAATDEAFPADFTVYGLCCPGDGSVWACGYAKTEGGPVRAAVWHRVAQ